MTIVARPTAVGRARPAVSVLVPARDAAATLPGALRSVARQSREDWECVVVDDGSVDETPAIVERAMRRDPRFVLIRRPPEGIVSALSAGLAACRAPAVARFDADDLMHRTRLEHQAAALRADPSLDAVGSHVRMFPRRSLGRGYRAYERWVAGVVTREDVVREAFVECPIVHPTLFARTSALREIGWRETPWAEDYDWLLRWLAAGRRVAVVPRRLVAWRRGPAGLSSRDPRYAVSSFVACKAHHLDRGFLGPHRTYRLWGYGHTGRALARALALHGRVPDRVVDVHPGRVGATVRGAPVVGPEDVGAPDGPPLIASVAGAEPRLRIRRFLAERGFVEGRDFVCAA